MKKIILFFIVLPLVYINFFSEKARLDREVNRLCAIDGGMKVYETVTLPADSFEKDGFIYIPSRQVAKPEDEYYNDGYTKYLVKGNPDLVQYHTQIYQQSDNKLLGEIISYSRRGGDFPGPWHQSSSRCPKETTVHLNKQIFIIE